MVYRHDSSLAGKLQAFRRVGEQTNKGLVGHCFNSRGLDARKSFLANQVYLLLSVLPAIVSMVPTKIFHSFEHPNSGVQNLVATFLRMLCQRWGILFRTQFDLMDFVRFPNRPHILRAWIPDGSCKLFLWKTPSPTNTYVASPNSSDRSEISKLWQSPHSRKVNRNLERFKAFRPRR